MNGVILHSARTRHKMARVIAVIAFFEALALRFRRKDR